MNRRVPPPQDEVGWQRELDELAERKRIAQEMGGKDRVERQHAGGRLTVRERIDKVLDAGSFHELGSVAGKAKYDKHGNMVDFMPGNGVFGRCRVNDRPVMVFGDDLDTAMLLLVADRVDSWEHNFRRALPLAAVVIAGGLTVRWLRS